MPAGDRIITHPYQFRPMWMHNAYTFMLHKAPRLMEATYIKWRRNWDVKVLKPMYAGLAEHLHKRTFPLFSAIEIETTNWCNNTCEFCPVNVYNNDQPKIMMPADRFHNLIDQLGAMNYTGEIYLYSNNEPLLDKRIIEFARYAREKVPDATLIMWTNGKVITIEKFVELMRYLDYMKLDNYSDDLDFIEPILAVYEYAKEKPEYQNGRLNIQFRLLTERLTTRAGEAKNRSNIPPIGIPCFNPFVQMVVKSDGRATLCSNDSKGMVTMGDTTKQSLVDIWRGPKYMELRRKILAGRRGLELCEKCDFM